MNISRKSALPVREIVGEAWRLYMAHFSKLAPIAALYAAGDFILSSTHAVNSSSFSHFFLVGFCVFAMNASVALLILGADYARRGEMIDVRAMFPLISVRIFRFILIGILQIFIFVLGLGLLVIPGFYWMILFSLTSTIFILEPVEVLQSFRLSRALIRENFWRVAGVYVFAFVRFLPVLLLSIALIALLKFLLGDGGDGTSFGFLVSFFIYPFLICVNVLLYSRLKSRKKDVYLKTLAESAKETPAQGCLAGLAIAMGAGLLIVVYLTLAGQFLRTDKGQGFLEFWAATVSIPLRIHEGVELTRPEKCFTGRPGGENGPFRMACVHDLNLYDFQIRFVSYEQMNTTAEDWARLDVSGMFAAWSRALVSGQRENTSFTGQPAFETIVLSSGSGFLETRPARHPLTDQPVTSGRFLFPVQGGVIGYRWMEEADKEKGRPAVFDKIDQSLSGITSQPLMEYQDALRAGRQMPVGRDANTRQYDKEGDKHAISA